MRWTSSIVSAVLGAAWLACGVLAALPEVLPHANMVRLPEAQELWLLVTNRKILPSTLHSINPTVGVTASWHHFLENKAPNILPDILADLKEASVLFHSNDYRAEPRFRKFLGPQNTEAVMAVAERGEQYTARRLVNAFVEQHFPLNRVQRREQRLSPLQRLARAAIEEERARLLRYRAGPSRARAQPVLSDDDAKSSISDEATSQFHAVEDRGEN